jgi:hypothetical protein
VLAAATPAARPRLIDVQNVTLNTALDNMSYGLCMFDASARLVLCNRRHSRCTGFVGQDAAQAFPSGFPGTPSGADATQEIPHRLLSKPYRKHDLGQCGA